MKKFAMTGGPGCGKSFASDFFRSSANWRVFDADAVCHEIYAAPAPDLLRSLRRNWGSSVIAPDGSVDRKKLADAVFQSPDGTDALNKLVHPAIRNEISRRMARLPEDAVALLDAALLYEAHWESLGPDGVIAVWTDEARQMERLASRGWSREHARRRIDAQLSAEEKLFRADYALINTGSPEFLYEQCRTLLNTIQQQQTR